MVIYQGRRLLLLLMVVIVSRWIQMVVGDCQNSSCTFDDISGDISTGIIIII